MTKDNLTLTEIVSKIRPILQRVDVHSDEEAAQLIQSYCDQKGYSKREFEMAYVFGLFGRNELGFWDGRFEENLKRWETVVKPGIFKFTRPDGKQPESELTRLREENERLKEELNKQI